MDNSNRHPDYIAVADRFWLAYDKLKETQPKGFQKNFINETRSDYGNFHRLKRDRWRCFELHYLTYIATNYKVSAYWLLTGNGEMF